MDVRLASKKMLDGFLGAKGKDLIPILDAREAARGAATS